MAWYDHEQPTKRKVEALTFAGAHIGWRRIFVAHVDAKAGMGLAPAIKTDLADSYAGRKNLGLDGVGISNIGVRVKDCYLGQPVGEGRVELIVVAHQAVART